MAASHFNILGLPNELIEMVAGKVSHTDLLTLRLVNKELAAKTERVMLDKCYNTLRIILAIPASLTRCLKIAMHPVLGSRITCVYIYVDKFCPDVLQDLRDDASSFFELPATGIEFEGHDDAQARHHLYQVWLGAQNDLRRSRKDQRLLNAIFTHLHFAGPFKHDISFLDLRSCVTKSREYRQLVQNYGAEIPLSRDEDARQLHMLFTSMAKSGTCPRTLSLGGTRYGIPMEAFSVIDDVAMTREWFARTEHLQVEIAINSSKNEDGTEHGNATHVVRFLELFSNSLTSLRLSAGTWANIVSGPDFGANQLRVMREVFSQIAAKSKFWVLEKVAITHFPTYYADLLHFLGKHRATLKTIEYHSVTVEGTGQPLSVKDGNKKCRADLSELQLPAPSEGSYIYYVK